MKQKKGFTLLEILVAVVLIGILAGIVLIAINPNRQLAQARDTAREIEVSKLQKALEEYALKNSNNYPPGVTTSFKDICDSKAETITGSTSCGVSTVNLKVLVPNYIPEIPKDPRSGTGITGYQIAIRNDRISIQAVLAETRTIGWNLAP